MKQKPQHIEARDLPDAWFQCLFKILEVGRNFTIDKGSFAGHKRLEFDHVEIQVTYPNNRPLLPFIEQHFGMPSPVSEEYLNQYLPYLMTDHVEDTETYTYGQRLTKYPIPKELIDKMDKVQSIFNIDIECWENPDIIKEENGQFYLNQIEWLIWTYKNKGPRNNQMTLQVGHPTDMILKDPPCLRQIDTRIQDEKLHFYPNFRSWDLYSGLPNNLAAIQLLKEYVSSCIGVEDGEILATSKGLHLYDYSVDFAKCLRMKDAMQK